MNLEQRVQALEQEVELLKAQIHATLLDIQEQLLTNTYPALRSGESLAQMMAVSENQTAPAANPPPVKRITLSDDAPAHDFEQDVQVQPIAHKRTFVEEPTQPSIPDWVERPERSARSQRGERPDASSIKSQADLSMTDWSELEEWVSQKVEKLGIQRTRELIDLYGRGERFTAHERLLLRQFVDIYDVDSESARSGSTIQGNRSPVKERPAIVPQTRAGVEQVRTELRDRQEKGRSQQLPEERRMEQRQLVLRLIGGILSAGEDNAAPAHNGNGHRKPEKR
ncbi:MAG: hypothetical protein SF123_06080 [Chloroflexota bacterium]|nr:hypothetical protein [Chloroflexota bacterium]